MQVLLLNAEQLAERLGVRARTVRDYARRGLIPQIEISPKVRRFDLDDVLEALKSKAPRAGLSPLERPDRQRIPSVTPRVDTPALDHERRETT